MSISATNRKCNFFHFSGASGQFLNLWTLTC